MQRQQHADGSNRHVAPLARMRSGARASVAWHALRTSALAVDGQGALPCELA